MEEKWRRKMEKKGKEQREDKIKMEKKKPKRKGKVIDITGEITVDWKEDKSWRRAFSFDLFLLSTYQFKSSVKETEGTCQKWSRPDSGMMNNLRARSGTSWN